MVTLQYYPIQSSFNVKENTQMLKSGSITEQTFFTV